MPQLSPFNITNWMPDKEHGLAYPEGAREKKIVISPSDVDIDCLKPGWRYLFKLSSHRYPEQFWAEVIAYFIGTNIGIQVPRAYAAYDEKTGESGALIEWFYGPAEGFVSAGNLYQRMIPNFDRNKGKQHNYKDALAINRGVLGHGEDNVKLFHEMMLFDALIGNTDRHQDNWGYKLAYQGVTGSTLWSFAPWFDNGTSLAHELSLKKVAQWDERPYYNYILRGKHHMRYTRHEDHQMSHIESLKLLVERDKETKNKLSVLVERFDFGALEWIVAQLVAMPMPDEGRLGQARADLILKITSMRHRLLRELLS